MLGEYHMGENLTLQGVLEKDVWIGGALLQVTEPRRPCYRFNARMDFGHAAKMMTQVGNSGFYLRVLDTGEVGAGDAVELIAGPRETSIAQVSERRRMGRPA